MGVLFLGFIAVVLIWAVTDYRVSISSHPDLPFDPADYDLSTLDLRGKVGWGLGWVSALLNSGARFVGFYEVKFLYSFCFPALAFKKNLCIFADSPEQSSSSCSWWCTDS